MVEYEIRFPDGRVFQCMIMRKRERATPESDQPAWTALDANKCRCCTLKSSTSPHCPLALDVRDVVKNFGDIPSSVMVEAVVKTTERWYFKKLPIEGALQSLLGLINATSKCPILSAFNSLAKFHLPFASVEETMFRAVSLYLFKQYYKNKDGKIIDLELKGLYELYENVRIVNQDFYQRLKTAAEADSTLNAVTKFISLSTGVGPTLEKFLNEFKESVMDPPTQTP